MKKIVMAVIAMVFLLSTAACSGGAEQVADKPVVTVTQAAPDTVDDTLTTTPDLTESQKDDVFVKVVSDKFPIFSTARSELIALGHNVCGAFDRGVTKEKVLEIGLDNGLTPQQIGYIVGAGVQVYCPEHLDLFNN